MSTIISQTTANRSSEPAEDSAIVVVFSQWDMPQVQPAEIRNDATPGFSDFEGFSPALPSATPPSGFLKRLAPTSILRPPQRFSSFIKQQAPPATPRFPSPVEGFQVFAVPPIRLTAEFSRRWRLVPALSWPLVYCSGHVPATDIKESSKYIAKRYQKIISEYLNAIQNVIFYSEEFIRNPREFGVGK